MSSIKEKPAIAKYLPLPVKIAEALPEASLEPMLGSIFFAIGGVINDKSNIKCVDQNRLDWHNSKMAIGFVGKFAEDWAKFIQSILPEADLFPIKKFYEGIDDNNLSFNPDSPRLMVSEDPILMHKALAPLPTVTGKSWRQSTFFKVMDSPAPTGDFKLIKDYLLAIANLPNQNCSLDSIAKLVYSDQLGDFKSEFISNSTGKLWIEGSDRLILKLALICHIAGAVGTIAPKLDAKAVTQAFELADIIKGASFAALGVRF